MPGMVPQARTGQTPSFVHAAAAAGFTRIVYRSRATRPFAGAALHELIRSAQSRNAAEQIGGVVVYDRGTFYQWLEGPAEGIDRVLGSINIDGRHTDIHVLAHQSGGGRLFTGWDMQLAGAMADGVAGHVVRPPAETIAALRHDPDAAAQILATLAPRRRPGRRPETPIARILRDVLLTRVIPKLADRHAPGRPGAPNSHPRVAELARLLAAGDSRGASALLIEALPGPGRLVPLLASLAEPAARLLGDYWAEDAIGELDVTLGLCCLRTAVRQAALGTAPVPPAPRAPRVLSAAQPGEPHALGQAIHPEAMWQAGWTPSIALPGAEDALLETLAGQRFDCLDLSLSAAFARDENLPGVAITIARARRASLNPKLAVVVSGRAMARLGVSPRPRAGFNDILGSLGADASILSALHVLGTVRHAVALRAA